MLRTNKNRILNKLVILLLLLLFVNAVALAQAVLTATVNKNAVSTSEQFQLTYSLNTSGRGFQGPDLKDFYVLGGPNQSTSMQFVNGSVSQSISFNYILQPKAEGTFKIGFASIEAEGKRIQSNGLIITVAKGAAQAQQQQGGNRQQGQQQDDGAGLSEKNLFIRAETSKSNAYRGEAIVVSFKLYTNVNIINYSVEKMPSMNGFWSQDVSMPQQLEFHVTNIEGVQYKVADIKKVILFPQRSGALSIDPMEAEVIARVQVKRQSQGGNDPFNDPFFNNPFFNNNVQDIKVPLKSDPIKINVKELVPKVQKEKGNVKQKIYLM